MADNVKRRDFLKGCAAAATLPGLVSAGDAEARTRPNLLVIVTDQQHWQALGVMDPFFETPNLDRLAREGVLFDHAFCTTPQCSPSRSSIYTGLFPHETGVEGNLGAVGHTGEPVGDLAPGFETAGSLLRQAGYHTGYTGKWHLGSHAHYADHFDLARLDTEAHDGATRDAEQYLAERAESPERPFALFVNYINPHDIYEFGFFEKPDPITPPDAGVPLPPSWEEDFAGKPKVHEEYLRSDQGKWFHGKGRAHWQRYREVYRDKCRLVDAQAGRLLERLDTLGLAENTVVLFLSDHGDMDTQHRLVYKGPFMYEHMVRVPLMARVPEGFGGRKGARVTDLVSLVDIVPTLCDFAGRGAPRARGMSLRPVLTGSGPGPERDFVVSQYYNKQRWVNPIRMVCTHTLKYNRYIGSVDELYDLERDPHEMDNRVDVTAYRARRDRLAELLEEWMARHQDTAFETLWATDRAGKRR